MNRNRSVASAVLSLLSVLLTCLSVASPQASAQDFPARPVHMIVSLSAGGPLDSFARIIGAQMQMQTGQSFVVENKPGGGGRIAIDTVLHAPADGYTLLVAGGSMTTLPYFVKGIEFDVLKDLTPITIAAESLALIVINSSVPAKNFQEFVAYAKANPGKLNYGSLGRQPLMLTLEGFQRLTGMRMVEVPFANSAAAVTALLRNDVQLTSSNFGTAASHIAAGTLRPLAVFGNQHLKAAPDIPTTAELGYPELRIPGWFALAANAKAPASTVDRLYTEAATALHVPEINARVEALGTVVLALTPAQSRERMATESQFWAKVAHEIGLQPQ